MTIIVLTNCPAKLRGDMTKWFAEINTGVFVGIVSARVRDEIWNRIVENIKIGQATMVFPAEGEQHMDFRVHNTSWEIVDLDGVKLMRRPSPETAEKQARPDLKDGFSNASRQRLIANVRRSAERAAAADAFSVLDLETTGLDQRKDRIIEAAALFVSDGKILGTFSALVSDAGPIPEKIIALTGITDEMAARDGKPLSDMLADLIRFLGDAPIVCHNAAFDINFLQTSLRKCGFPIMKNKIIDTLPLARKKLDLPDGYKLAQIAAYYGIDFHGIHRAQADCRLTYEVFLRLNQS